MLTNSSPLDPSLTNNPIWRIAIVRSVWHRECTDALNADAIKALVDAGISKKNIMEIEAPGSFEIPLLCQTLLEYGEADGVIAFGIIVQGATHHAEMIARECGRAIMNLQLLHRRPVINEILYVDTLEDAKIRSIGEHGKGRHAAHTLLSALARNEQLH